MVAQSGSGHVATDPALVRSHQLRPSFTEGQVADIRAIAEAWGIAMNTAVWAIVIERLDEWRGKHPELGALGLKRAAAAHALLAAGLPLPSGQASRLAD